jgi:hypothetical protein
MKMTNRKLGGILTLGSSLPFIAGLFYHVAPNGAMAGGPDIGVCPLRLYLGIPCALCGASRSFTMLMNSDASWLLYNPWWVLFFACTGLLGIMLLFSQSFGVRFREFVRRQSNISKLMAFSGVVLMGWITAFINFSHVVPLP